MSIVALRKVTLFGLAHEKEAVLKQVQALGSLHLCSLAPVPKEPEKQPPGQPVESYKALRYLLGVKHKRRQVQRAEGFDMQAVVKTQKGKGFLELRDVPEPTITEPSSERVNTANSQS